MPDAHCPSMAMLDYQPDPSVGAVVLGFDLDITYHKLARAATHLSDPKCLFFATNSDASFPANGRLYPGTGAILAALQTGSGRTATVIGKPNSLMLDLIVAKYKCDKSRTVMIGDRLDTDILFGKQGGVKTCLVMTGVTRPETIAVGMAIEPDYVIDSLGSLMA